MEKWVQLSSAIYYTGVGAVLLGTSFRFLYNLFQELKDNRQFVLEFRGTHLQNIYKALEKIGDKLGIDLEIPPPQA